MSVLKKWGCAPSPFICWEICKCRYGDELVAIDWDDTGDCWCQGDCGAWQILGRADVFLITRDSVVPRCRKYAMIIMTGR